MMWSSECTVVVASCDKYADLLEPFSVLWKKFWPDCPFETVLVTETAPSATLCFDRVVACGKGGNWCSRLVTALERISTPRVIMLCDDYLLNGSVDTALVLKRLEQAKRFKAVNLRMIPCPKPTQTASEGLLEYRKNTAYCIATQAGIWDREFLKALATGKSSIWEFERYGSFGLENETRPILCTPTKEFPFVDAVHKGCWEKFGLKVLKDNGLAADLSKRGLPSLKTRFVEGFKALVFALLPNTWIVRVQNAFNFGAKEQPSSVSGRRLLFVSASRSPWYAKGTSAAEHFAKAPYSVDAIGYNLEKIGWTVSWLGMADTANPFHLAREIDAFKPDVIYTYGSTSAVWPIFLKHVLCRHRKFVVVHGWDDPYDRIWNEMFGWPGKVLMRFVQKFLVKRSDAVVTLSYALQKLGRTWGVACKYIPNGADPIEPVVSTTSIKLEGRFKLVYTGDKAKWKRTEDICRAMRELPRDIKLYMTGRDYDHLRGYLSDNCISLGWLSKEEQYAVMRQADAFVCTSNQDCNAKLQEYLRWQKPILALHGEPDNFFKDGENALLATDGDYAPLVRRLADDPALCRRLADNAARQIPVYSWAEIARQFDAYFKELLEGE